MKRRHAPELNRCVTPALIADNPPELSADADLEHDPQHDQQPTRYDLGGYLPHPTDLTNYILIAVTRIANCS